MVASGKTPWDARFSVQLDRVQFAANILGVFGMLLASLQPNISPNIDQCEVLDRSVEDDLIWCVPNARQVLPSHALRNPQSGVILDWFSGLSVPQAPQMTWTVIFPFPKTYNQEHSLIPALENRNTVKLLQL